MAFQSRRVRDYAKRIAEEEGIPQEVVNKLLMYFAKNVMHMVKQKEDIRLTGVGRIWIDKPHTKKKKPIRKNGSDLP